MSKALGNYGRISKYQTIELHSSIRQAAKAYTSELKASVALMLITLDGGLPLQR
jgi:hypothetical protein